MKYKNIELITGDDSEAELSCGIEFDNPNENENLVDDLIDEVIDLFKDFGTDVYVEQYSTDLLGVRCNYITFDKAGVELLTKIYNALVGAKLSVENQKVLIDINIDSEEWFKREDGSEYNCDSATLEEFLENIEY